MVYRPQSAKKNAVKQRQAVASGGSCYSQWRAHCLPDVCRESFADDTPPEIVLQRIWQAQLLRRTRLKLTDGRPIQVLHPGFWNHEAGPDFQKAVIRLGDAPALSGAIEVDPLASDWKAHRHDINPAFENVMLHVIWAGPASTHMPTLRLQPHLSGSLTDLVRDMRKNNGLPDEFSGQCRAPLADLDHAAQQSLLSEAAEVRIQSKARALIELARLCGWESALWRGLFRALGYKHNIWPMQHLAEQLPAMQALGRWMLRVGRRVCWEWPVGCPKICHPIPRPAGSISEICGITGGANGLRWIPANCRQVVGIWAGCDQPIIPFVGLFFWHIGWQRAM